MTQPTNQNLSLSPRFLQTAAQNAILKTALERQIAERHPSIKIIRPRPNTKSDVWCHDFYRLVFKNGKKQNFILCIDCERVITYKSKQGTGSLLRHRCFRDRKKMQQALEGVAAAAAAGDGRSADQSVAAVEKPKALSFHQRRDEIKRLIEENDPVVQLRDTGRQGFVWSYNNFKNVYRDEVRQNFVFCISCQELIVYPIRKGGVSSLLRHNCFCELANTPCDTSAIALLELIAKSDPSIRLKLPSNLLVARQFRIIYKNELKMEYVLCIFCNQLIKGCTVTTLLAHQCPTMHSLEQADTATIKEEPIEAPGIQLSPEALQEMAQCQMEFLTKTMMPAKIMETEEFQRLAQHFVKIGSNYGQVNVTDLLLDRTQLLIERTRMLSQIHSNLQNIIANYHLSYACDMWHDANRNKYYLSLAGHYIDENFERQRCVFGVRTITHSESQRAEHVRNNVVEILRACSGHSSHLETERFIANSVMVSNMHCDRSDRFTAISCAATKLTDIVGELLADPLLEVAKTCSLIRAICKDFPKSPAHQASLQWVLDEYDPTSWSYVWQLLNRCSEAKDSKELSTDMMASIHVITNILQPFQQASLSLSCNSTPTINQVYVFRKKLEDVFVLPYYNEPAAIGQLKTKARTLIQEKFSISNLHKLAVFLDPRFKSLKFLTDSERTAVIAMTKKLIAGGGTVAFGRAEDLSKKRPLIKSVAHKSEYLMEYMDDKVIASSTTSAGSSRMDTKSEYLMEYMDDHVVLDGAANEVDIYLNLKLNNSIATDILQFWKTRKDLPRLRELARSILCIPACSSAGACVFSEDAAAMAKKRLAVDADDLAAALLINGNPRLD